MTNKNKTSKVLFRVSDGEGGTNVETLWTSDLGNDKYKMDNSPFYAYSVSWNDIIFAPYNEDEGFPTFEKVIEKCGHRTIRVIFNPPIEEGNKSNSQLKNILKLGCSYEGANNKFISIDIPPEIELDSICKYLIEENMQWEHADPCYDDLYPEV